MSKTVVFVFAVVLTLGHAAPALAALCESPADSACCCSADGAAAKCGAECSLAQAECEESFSAAALPAKSAEIPSPDAGRGSFLFSQSVVGAGAPAGAVSVRAPPGGGKLYLLKSSLLL
ncbi:MAG: hypothetical protein ACT4O3_08410 [Elusimicrobiota bacterium]